MAREARILRTAPELEQLILTEMRKAAICSSVTAVTVSPMENGHGSNWDVTHINTPGGGEPPQVCVDICADAVATLRQQYDLLLEIEADEL